MNPHTYGQLIFHKGGKNMKWEKDSHFRKWCWEGWTVACKLMKLKHTLSPCTKITSKWLKDLNIRYDTIKLLEEIIGKTFSEINCTNASLGHSPKAIAIKTKIKINKWDLWTESNLQTLHGNCESVSRSVVSDSLRPEGWWPTRLLCPWNSPGKNTGEGSHSFLQGIFPTQWLQLDLPHCRQILYSLSHQQRKL